MKITTLNLTLLFCLNLSMAQNGDEIASAVICDDTSVTATHVIDATETSISGLNCVGGGEDAFYLNVIEATENKIVISMNTSVGVATTIDYQILRAPNGNIANFEQVFCDSYQIFAAVPMVNPGGGSFSKEITTNVYSGDEFYLRVYKPSGIAATLVEDLFNGTTVSMLSEFDGTLSTTDLAKSSKKIISKQNELNILNNIKNNAFKIYGMDGKIVLDEKRSEPISYIDTSFLTNGLYILELQSTIGYTHHKFIKY